jgi:hypothetical protein
MDDSTIELCWLPLGAGPGGGPVRFSGRVYEALAAWRGGRSRRALFHSALRVGAGGTVHTIEMAPVWAVASPERGVVAEGAVGLPWLGRSRWFRYEVRRWAGGRIPDLEYSLDGPRPVPTDPERVTRLVEIVSEFPTLTWGRDELATGEMWNSNSLTSWLLASSGHDVNDLTPPDSGRAPGWDAGLVVARRGAAARSRRRRADLGAGPSREHGGEVLE